MIGIIFGIDSSVFSTLQCIVFIGHIYGERMYKAIAKFKMATMTRIRDGPTGGLPSLCAMELCTRRKVKYVFSFHLLIASDEWVLVRVYERTRVLEQSKSPFSDVMYHTSSVTN
jgi:hypothetical protein